MRGATSFLICLALVLSPSAALAYSDTGWDPADRPVTGDPDIQYSTREVYSLDGVRYVKVQLDAYEELSDWWRTRVALDTRDGQRVDFWMQFANYDTGGVECKVWGARRDEDTAVKGHFKQSGDKASCRVLAALLRPAKEISWYLQSPAMHGQKEDRAPDAGWYP